MDLASLDTNLTRECILILTTFHFRQKHVIRRIPKWDQIYKYNLSYILPWKLAIIFYGEYAAYADREYMSIKDKWSRLIESTHAFFCASFSLISVILYMFNECERAEITWTIAMGSQLMNSILYMGQYIVQTNDIYSPNYNSEEFPCGFLFLKRPFMYINIFWSLMPTYAIIRLLC